MFLVVKNDSTVPGTEVIVENLKKYWIDDPWITKGQWKIGRADDKGYFTITKYASGKVLSAKSKHRLTIEGM